MADGVVFPADVPGALDLFNWFGSWPNFENAEVRSVHLNREGPSRIRVHVLEKSQGAGSKRGVVTFVLGGVSDLALNGFNTQNILSALRLTKEAKGYKLELSQRNGIGGTMLARSVRIEFAVVE